MSNILHTIVKVADASADALGVFGGISALAGKFKRVAREVRSGTVTEKSSEGKTETTAPETEKAPEVRFGGIFDYSDETGIGKLFGELGSIKDFEKAPGGISLWIEKNLEPDEQRRFRVIMSNLGRITVEKAGEIFKKSEFEKRFPKKGFPPNIEKGSSEERLVLKENFGIAFLKVFSKAGPIRKKAMCQAIGVFDSPMAPIDEAIAETFAFLQENETHITAAVKTATAKLKAYNGNKKYEGFWSANFPKKERAQSTLPPMPDLTKEKYFWPVVLTACVLGFVFFWPLSLVALALGLLTYGFVTLGKRFWPVSFIAFVVGLLIYGVIHS